MYKTGIISLNIVLLISFAIAEKTEYVKKVFHDNGSWTGLYNLNPDINDEPWLVHSSFKKNEKDIQLIENAPKLVMSRSKRNRELPKIVDNTKHVEFPPIFNQVGGSCAQASGISYCLSYESNLVRSIIADSNNQLAYGFTYSYLNGGLNNKGTVSIAGWEIGQSLGIPTRNLFDNALNANYDGTAWMNGYEKWHQANVLRVKDYYSIDIANEEGLLTLKNWLYDHGRGDSKGGVAVFSSSMFFEIKTITSGEYKDSLICVSKGSNTDAHAMTFAGYNDEIGYDINEDGEITNHIDINDDGIVDFQDWEKGALLLVNSWGPKWKSGGKVWVSYSTLAKSITGKQVFVVNALNHKPRFEYKVKITSKHRNSFTLSAGMSNDISSILPIWSKTFGGAFDYSGGDHPMEGKGANETLEFGLDVSDWADSISSDSIKFFFTIESNMDHGTIDYLSVIDYNSSIKKEIAFNLPDKSIKNGLWVYTQVIKPNEFLSLSFPSGGEEFQKGGTYPIKWHSDKSGTINIFLLKGNKKIKTIASNIDDNGEYQWSLNNLDIGEYKIQIEDKNGNISNCQSTFSVVPAQSIVSFPFIMDFDDLDTGNNMPNGWSKGQDDDCNWTIWQGATPAKGKTGAEEDHTTGNGKYAFIESSSPNFPFKVATIITPNINLKNAYKSELSFFYHMYSSQDYMGDLCIDILSDGLWYEDVIKIAGDQGNEWKEQKFSIDQYNGKIIQIRFRGITGESYTSDICIDDIKIDAKTPIIKNTVNSLPSLFKYKYTKNELLFFLPNVHQYYSIAILNSQGRNIMNLENLSGGKWNGINKSLSNGIYLLNIKYSNKKEFKTKVLITN